MEAARNDPNVRIYKNDSILTADRTFERALKEYSIAFQLDPDLGSVKMQNVMFRMSETPGQIRWAGRRLGQNNHAVYCEELGLSEADLSELHEKGVL